MEELCPGGDVASLLTASGGRLDEREAAAVMSSVLQFLAAAHARRVCYGDIKPENFSLRRLYPCIDHIIDPAAPKGCLDVAAVDFGCCQITEPEMCLPDVVGTKAGWPCLFFSTELAAGCLLAAAGCLLPSAACCYVGVIKLDLSEQA